MPKSKPILVGVLHRPPEKPRFIEYLDNFLKESNIFNIQECYLMCDLLDKQYYDSYSQASPLVKKYMDHCFSHSLHQLTVKPTRTTERTKTLIDHILTKSLKKVIQSGVIEMGLSDHGLIYRTRRTTL